jgi:CBS domain-containing protein
VVRDGELEGVITTRDLIRLVAAPRVTAEPAPLAGERRRPLGQTGEGSR